ncbi:ribokinase [Coraliomargarita sp. SDUM461004]|uniref:Ribokinase n=1 Tax=Thalassobacterium sedimentorum TaxID=3041258 RepID=A0ABU1AJK7_9BACT|nr:ribokinase [Coraliomargarita sp. SDUM461004]MDQ8194939.1 ribokinase [Coraliomargarita sp. SDUM461004]
MNAKHKIISFGSLNVDHVWHLDSLPSPGVTIACDEASRSWGGKGANQAVAAARMGGDVTLVAALKGDSLGHEYVKYLSAQGIETDLLNVQLEVETGSAQIYVDQHGENMIVVHGGANELWTKETARSRLQSLLGQDDILLLQFEVPVPAVMSALDQAQQVGSRSVLNASPVNNDFPWGKCAIDTIIVNEHECLEIFGKAPNHIFAWSATEVKELLRRYRIGHLIVTRGARATYLISEVERAEIPTFPVSPVDTVGAGDTFAGVLGACLARSIDWKHAIATANYAAAMATLKHGAQAAMPFLSALEMPMKFRRFPTLQKKL